MTITAIVPFLVCLLGLVIYLVTPAPRVRTIEAGRIAYAVGLLVAVYTLASQVVHIGTR